MGKISLEVNGRKVEKEAPDNTLLSTFLREHLQLTGTHIGCDTSQCGACVVHVCLLYTSPSPRDVEESRMPSSA